MPYDIKREGDGWVVINTSNGKRFSKKPLPEDRARNQMKALYAAEQDQISYKSTGYTGACVITYIPQDVGSQLLSIARNALGPNVELLPLEELHVTLAYLGDANELDYYNPGTKDKALRAVRNTTEQYQQTVGDTGWCGSINGFLRFFPLDEELGTPLAFTVDSSCLADWRPRLVENLENEEAYVDRSHGFVPHITVAYLPRYFPMPDVRFSPVDVIFDEICLEWGEESNPFSLVAPTATPNGPSGGQSGTSSFIVYKEAGSEPRWLMVSSSSFGDRDGEWVSSKSLVEDEVRADLLAEVIGPEAAYGPLRWWHVGFPYLAVKGDWTSAVPGPGIDLGWCDFSTTHQTEYGVSLIESGTFVSKEVADVVEANAPFLGASLTFSHPPDQPGRGRTFSSIRKVERSLLPQPHNSNLAAAFVSMIDSKEAGSMDKSKIDRLVQLGMSPESVDYFLTEVTTRQKELKAQGIISKEAAATSISGTDAEAVTAALDAMASGVLALKAYVEGQGKKSVVADKPKDEEDAEDEMKKADKSKVPPGLKKKEGDPAQEVSEAPVSGNNPDYLTQKQVGDMFLTFKQAVVTEVQQAIQQALAPLQAESQVTQKAVKDITTYLAQVLGESPPAVVASPATSQANVIDSSHPLHQKEAGGGANGFADGPFGWLDQKLGFGQSGSTPPVVPQV